MNNEQRNIERGRCAEHQFETTFSHPRKLRLVIRHKRGGRALREGSEDQARRKTERVDLLQMLEKLENFHQVVLAKTKNEPFEGLMRVVVGM